MELLEKVYEKTPVFFQNIMCTVSGYKRNLHRYGKVYYEHRKFLKDFDKWPIEEKEKYQINRLREFLKYVVENSKFYAEYYKGIDIDSINSIDDLKILPIIDKEILRENIQDVFTVDKKDAFEGHTGGTTGKSLVVRFIARDTMERMAMLDHFKARVGFEHRKMKRATFNGKHIIPPSQKKNSFWRYNAACKQMIYSSFHLTESKIGFYVESLNKFKPNAIDGFFTSMCDVASYIERHNIELKFKPVGIFPTSETVTEEGKQLLERVFGCKVYNQYASSEGAPFVTACKNQNLHIELSTGVFEKMSEDSDEILVTSFTTHGTPLVRYKIGDCMEFDYNKNCDCGLNTPIVKSIQGRRLDFLYTPEGGKINAGNVANLLKNIPNAVIRAQFIQEKMDEIKVLLEVDSKLYKEEYEQKIREEFTHKFGEKMRVDIQFVKEIPRAKSGKFRMILNSVDSNV